MTDQYGREIDYLRISVTDRCNLRCVYCMPEEGVESVSHDRILRFQEITRICRILAARGLRKVKITGGEPLVRRGVAELIRELKAIPGIESVTITTNGVLLEEMYDSLVEAGIDAVTVSLDTLDRELYRKLTRRDELSRVMRGIRLAVERGKVPVKINCVPMYGVEEQGLLALAELARDQRIHVRFIEMMPIGCGSQFTFIKEEELRARLEERFGRLCPCDDVEGNGPCAYYRIEGFKGRIGFISAVSHKFCDSCNRVRLTAEGFLKTCLQYDVGAELKPLLTAGCSDQELERTILDAIDRKPKSHHFGTAGTGGEEERRGMSQIGG